MKKAELLKILNSADDDFEIKLYHTTRIPQETLDSMSYPYPFNHQEFTLVEKRDIGYSDKVVSFEISEIN